MLKSIKIQGDIYDALNGQRLKNETFGECINRLITACRKLLEIQYGEKPEGKP